MRERRELGRQVGQPARRERRHRRREHFTERGWRRRHECQVRRVGGQRKGVGHERVRRADARHRTAVGIDAKQVRGSLLQAAEIDAVRRPGDQARILVEGVRDRSGRSAGGRHHGEAGICVIAVRAAHRRLEDELTAVGGPLRVRVRPRLGDEPGDALVARCRRIGGLDRQQEDVERLPVHEVGRRGGAEREARAVRRPREVDDVKRVPLGALGARERLPHRLGDVQGPDVAVRIVAADHVEVAHVVLARLEGLGLHLRGHEGNRPSVGRPGEVADRRFRFGELHRLTPVGTNREDLIPIADARAREGEPPAVGRPSGRPHRLGAARQLERRATARRHDPEVRDEGVVLEVRLVDRIGDESPVRRNLGAADGLDGEEVVDRRDPWGFSRRE